MSAPGVGAGLVGVAALVMLLVWIAPPVLVHLVVRAYPPGHPRRAELLRELEDVALRERLRWVVSLALPCAREGAAARRADQHGKPQRRRVNRTGPAALLAASLSAATVMTITDPGVPAVGTVGAALIAGAAAGLMVVLGFRLFRGRPDNE